MVNSFSIEKSDFMIVFFCYIFVSIGCKNTEQSMHSLNVGLYGSGPSKPAAQTSLDQIPRVGPPTET